MKNNQLSKLLILFSIKKKSNQIAIVKKKIKWLRFQTQPPQVFLVDHLQGFYLKEGNWENLKQRGISL